MSQSRIEILGDDGVWREMPTLTITPMTAAWAPTWTPSAVEPHRPRVWARANRRVFRLREVLAGWISPWPDGEAWPDEPLT